jgi:hypothetical protein
MTSETLCCMKWTKFCKLVLIIGSRVKNMDCSSSSIGCARQNWLVYSLSGHLVSSGRQVPLKVCWTGWLCHIYLEKRMELLLVVCLYKCSTTTKKIYCSLLKHPLRRAGISTTSVNAWHKPRQLQNCLAKLINWGRHYINQGGHIKITASVNRY